MLFICFFPPDISAFPQAAPLPDAVDSTRYAFLYCVPILLHGDF